MIKSTYKSKHIVIDDIRYPTDVLCKICLWRATTVIRARCWRCYDTGINPIPWSEL